MHATKVMMSTTPTNNNVSWTNTETTVIKSHKEELALFIGAGRIKKKKKNVSKRQLQSPVFAELSVYHKFTGGRRQAV